MDDGTHKHRAITGHAIGAGRNFQIAQSVRLIGIAHHKNAGRTTNGRNNNKVFGG